MTAPEAPAKSAALINFEKMLASGKDSALLRFSIGNEYAKARDWVSAADALARSVALDPQFTAAWKIYARALMETGRPREALAAYRTGIDVARSRCYRTRAVSCAAGNLRHRYQRGRKAHHGRHDGV